MCLEKNRENTLRHYWMLLLLCCIIVKDTKRHTHFMFSDRKYNKLISTKTIHVRNTALMRWEFGALHQTRYSLLIYFDTFRHTYTRRTSNGATQFLLVSVYMWQDKIRFSEKLAAERCRIPFLILKFVGQRNDTNVEHRKENTENERQRIQIERKTKKNDFGLCSQ